jgi:hypothetical protein
VIRASWVRHNEGAADGAVLKKNKEKNRMPFKNKNKSEAFFLPSIRKSNSL